MARKTSFNSLLQGVSSGDVRNAFSKIDRALFVPGTHQDEAWADRPLPIEDKATISQPSLVARMTDWLEVGPGSRVLEIGTGSGYQTAILAELAAEVVSVEFSPILCRIARERLHELGYDNVRVHQGDGSKGWAENAPYDRIIATVAFPGRPAALLEQLSPEDGIALVPVGSRDEPQQLRRYHRAGEEITEESLLPVRFLSLR